MLNLFRGERYLRVFVAGTRARSDLEVNLADSLTTHRQSRPTEPACLAAGRVGARLGSPRTRAKLRGL